MILKKIKIRITKNNNYGLFITSLIIFIISNKKILFDITIFNEFLTKILQLVIPIIINDTNFDSYTRW